MDSTDPFSSGLSERMEAAVLLARTFQERAVQLQSSSERRQQAELDRMLQNPSDKVTLLELTDQAFRSNAAARTYEHLTHILDVQGVPRFFSPLDRALLRGFQTFGGWLPGVSVPLVREHMQHETANVVLPAEEELLRKHLAARSNKGVRMNLNFLGEALLGEEEATRRLETYLEGLQLPEVEVMSVKISTLYSQVSSLAWEHTLKLLCDRLERLYRESDHLLFTRPDGSMVPKFIYLDMEEYRDLHLTVQAFMQTLDRPGLENVSAGIALQAYIPESFRAQQEINEWARKRVARGGPPITIRIVKGANLEMERVEASLGDWPQAPFKTKQATDANYKRMLHQGFQPENLPAVRLGVASHNLFDLAYGLVLAGEVNAGDQVQFEMLEGMANHQRRALHEKTRDLLLYAPACRKDEFVFAIGYLIRRLDENTGPENFLRHAFKLKVGSADWEKLERRFRECFKVEVSNAPRRSQNRLTETFDAPRAEMSWTQFQNEPHTDWALPHNSRWARRLVEYTKSQREAIPLVIAGREIPPDPFHHGKCLDPSRPGAVPAHYSKANPQQIEQAVTCARSDPDQWRSFSPNQRSEVLGRAALEIRRARSELMQAALVNGGKVLTESDPEVSEAVDFVELYRGAARFFYERPGIQARGRGVIVVVPPWNFPIAIPCGGVAAALAAGNTVLLKPASNTVLVAWELCQCFWRAGVSRTALQFVPCPGDGAGQSLVAHPDVNGVILTGGTATAQAMLRSKSSLRLNAETGGKNAIVVTSLSDRELAVKYIVHSAFSHAGQKCSAASLLLLEKEVYEDAGFKRMLCDAVKSLHVGPAFELHTRVGPLIRPPGPELERGLKTLEPGESWAVMPCQVSDNPHLWSPGVKYGVRPGSFTHGTELFGPVLGVMPFETLQEAIEVVNQTGYGLTSGLFSLDEREHAQWREGILAGNLYINRGITGSVVLRQPFGGMGRSSFGSGLKAGSPNYVAQFMTFQEDALERLPEQPVTHPHVEELRQAFGSSAIFKQIPALKAEIKTAQARLLCAIESYDHWWLKEFSREHDHFRLLGQDNIRRYRAFREILVRVTSQDDLFEVFARVCAARITGARVVISSSHGFTSPVLVLLDELTQSWAASIEFLEQTDEQLAATIRSLPAHANERIRYAAPERVPERIRTVAAEHGVYLADEPVLAEGRIELLWYLREQSISYDYHRYGNLGGRSGEQRREPL